MSRSRLREVQRRDGFDPWPRLNEASVTGWGVQVATRLVPLPRVLIIGVPFQMMLPIMTASRQVSMASD